jgi:glutamate/aspartate transport system substrate-binding protein
MRSVSSHAGNKKHPAAICFRTVWFTSLLALTSLSAAAGTLEKISQTGVLTIGYKIAVPFAYQDDANRPIGYSIDLCLKVADAIKRELKRPDLVIKYATVTSATRFTDLAAGAIDIECGNTTNTAERRTKAAFTIPTFIAASRLLVRIDSGIKSSSNLNGKTVVTTSGSSSETLFKNLNDTRSLGAKLVLTKDYAESFAAVEEGKADAFVMDDVVLYSLRAASKEPTKYEITHDALTVEPLSIMLRKDDPAFKKLVDTEITRVILSGEINPIYRKWFESPIPPKMLNLRVPMSYMLRDSFKVPTDWLPD